MTENANPKPFNISRLKCQRRHKLERTRRLHPPKPRSKSLPMVGGMAQWLGCRLTGKLSLIYA